MFTTELATVSYIGATILFILSLGGLSNQETALRGNLYGMIGMALAVLATVFGPQVTMAGLPWIIAAMLIGGSIGLYAARTVQMTQMPELVALMHSAALQSTTNPTLPMITGLRVPIPCRSKRASWRTASAACKAML